MQDSVFSLLDQIMTDSDQVEEKHTKHERGGGLNFLHCHSDDYDTEGFHEDLDIPEEVQGEEIMDIMKN